MGTIFRGLRVRSLGRPKRTRIVIHAVTLFAAKFAVILKHALVLFVIVEHTLATATFFEV
jgi:hypothetical protein